MIVAWLWWLVTSDSLLASFHPVVLRSCRLYIIFFRRDAYTRDMVQSFKRTVEAGCCFGGLSLWLMVYFRALGPLWAHDMTTLYYSMCHIYIIYVYIWRSSFQPLRFVSRKLSQFLFMFNMENQSQPSPLLCCCPLPCYIRERARQKKIILRTMDHLGPIYAGLPNDSCFGPSKKNNGWTNFGFGDVSNQIQCSPYIHFLVHLTCYMT